MMFFIVTFWIELLEFDIVMLMTGRVMLYCGTSISVVMEGYHPGHYDVLIDLYQVGNTNIVASYSSDDSQALYGLPLESADYDRVYVDSVYIHHGGSLSTLSLIMLFLLLASRLSRGLSRSFNIRF